MRRVFARAAEWIERDGACALATLVSARDAAPASIGTTLAVSARREIAGNIGAGCYEGAIVEACEAALRDGRSRLLDVDLSEDDELSPSTGCGGLLRVVAWRAAPNVCDSIAAAGRGEIPVRISVAYELEGRRAIFELSVAPKRRIVLVGATALADDVAALADTLDWSSVVVDPRSAFAVPERLPHVNSIVSAWPDEALMALLSSQTPLVILSHDPKLDLPALRCALASAAPYIGILGSRRAQQSRQQTLLAEGFDASALERIHGPAGLDIGGTNDGETAISIVSEIVAVLRGREGGSLRRGASPIHSLHPSGEFK